MTSKTLISSILLTTSFLLLTACNDQNESKTNMATETSIVVPTNTTEIHTNTDITNDDTTVEGGDASTAGTSEGVDNNISMPPGVTLTSLKLSIDKTSLNKDEKTTVKVVAIYSDDTSKEVTDKVEWIVTPDDTVKVTNTTLVALKDVDTTVKVKMDTVTSDAINLKIYWKINGYMLPPELDPSINNSTLLGIDANGNGVRDDVERWIYDRYKNDHPIMIPLKMQASRAYRYIIQDPSKAGKRRQASVNSSHCEEAFTSLIANYFGRKPLVLKDSETQIKEMKEMKEIQYNTTQRARAYGEYNQNLSGGVFDDGWPEESWIKNCDFDTRKYIEISEKL